MHGVLIFISEHLPIGRLLFQPCDNLRNIAKGADLVKILFAQKRTAHGPYLRCQTAVTK